MNAVTVFSLYVSSSAVTPLYSRPSMLWLLNPLLLYWFGRALMMAHRREMPLTTRFSTLFAMAPAARRWRR